MRCRVITLRRKALLLGFLSFCLRLRCMIQQSCTRRHVVRTASICGQFATLNVINPEERTAPITAIALPRSTVATIGHRVIVVAAAVHIPRVRLDARPVGGAVLKTNVVLGRDS